MITYGSEHSTRESRRRVRGQREESVEYQKPTITDLGSIADHTFTSPGGDGKGAITCDFCDPHGELSHSNVNPPGQG